MLELYLLGVLILALTCKPHKRKCKVMHAERARVPRVTRETGCKASVKVINLAQLEAMEDQVNAACELGIALDRKAREQDDNVKRARLAQQSANAYAKAASIQAKIDKMMIT